MERRTFLRNCILTAGSVLIGGSAIFRFLKVSKQKEEPLSTTIETICQGNGKNVLVLMSAGTRKGNTDRLTDAYIRGLSEKGHSVTKVYLGSMHMAGCRGCGACQHNGNRCVVQDDMQLLYPLFVACDMLVMASPLYFWTITAKLKSFIERLYAISVEDKYPEKETVLLMTAGDNNKHTFDQALNYFHIISGVLGGKEIGTYLAGGCTGCENISRQIAPEHLEKAYKMGLDL
ncbi:flavodoxin family protein [Parabacteroides sp. AGMB00274]|uniref:Flavodoxin family protein n=1 Tax=Parabacteroides faecalis TaxID=2924040 RepID=A0ABT0BXX0_9BACT|nr:flavodoxin family protein [Parabacteroides faecalis]MCI7286752.1 flavodoxin family protein [Parabacteroides sp.]MCJ2379510.1 flavodoxin family protein [Parabacteroides faecalis]MDY6254826.1 flavodoxin family protein [Bacteroidales bacterium]